MQNVFIKLLNRSEGFVDTEHEKAWLITCSINHCKDILKSAYRKRTDFEVPDVADKSTGGDSFDELTQAILSLPEKYKDCVYLHYYEGYKTEEIAQMTGKPGSTIRNYLSEARATLREKLGGAHNE